MIIGYFIICFLWSCFCMFLQYSDDIKIEKEYSLTFLINFTLMPISIIYIIIFCYKKRNK
jgi:hypothetical protein